MSKSKKNIQEEVKTEELENTEAIASGVVEEKKVETKKDDSKKESKKKDKKKKKEKKSLAKKTKEVTSELKKVTWPSFGDVVKKTGIVIAFVIIFGIMIYIVDSLAGLLSTLLVG